MQEELKKDLETLEKEIEELKEEMVVTLWELSF